jgi:hypothetical protein
MKSRPVNALNSLRNLLADMIPALKPEYKLTSGWRKPNKKKRRGRHRLNVQQGQGKLGNRGYDGTMFGPFRSRGGGK